MKRLITSLAVLICLASSGVCGEDGYVRVHAGGGVAILGPTGIHGYRAGARKMPPLGFLVVDRVALKSPAHGFILKDDLILGANGKAFPKGKDPRYQFAHAIIDSEARDGILQLQISRGGKPMTVAIQLERMPDYSPTWPVNCKRSDRMLTDACEFLSGQQLPSGVVQADEAWVGGCQAPLLWMAVGDPRYFENARRAVYWYISWMEGFAKEGKNPPWGPWGSSYGAVALAEYYNMTGDRGVLPGLELAAKMIAHGQFPSGGWSHYFYSGYGISGYGEINNGGMVCYMALLMAKECGLKVDEAALRRAVVYFEKYAPVVQNRYGDNMYATSSLGYGTMNGKVPGLAVAHSLNGRQADAAAFALKSARSVNSVEGGHTGHFFNILWTPIGASLAPGKESRQAMDQIGWYYSLARDWRGAFESTLSNKYSQNPNMTTAGTALGLASWKRRLRIHGAPKTVFLETLPVELEAAKKLHQANKWDQAVSAVDTFLKKGGHSAKTVRLANELRDKSRYVKQGAEMALAKLDKISQGGRMRSRAYETVTMLGLLRGLYEKDDPRVAAIEDRLPEPWRNVYSRAQWFYNGFKTLRDVRTENWFIYGVMVHKALPDLAIPSWEPDWTPLAATTGEATERTTHIAPSSADIPKGWADIAFDDKPWKVPVKRSRRWRPKAGSVRLIRVAFDHSDETPRRLRMAVERRKPGLPAGSKVYLNGTLVLKTFYGCGTFELLKKTSFLLRRGRNVLAIEAPIDSKGRVPEVALQAAMPIPLTSFSWTKVPGQDAEYGKLVAKRRVPRPYYIPANDKRTPKELVKALTVEPYFMPDGYYALERFKALKLGPKEQSKHISALLKSSCWGARWAGAVLIERLMTPMDGRTFKRLPEAERDKVMAAQDAGRNICDGFRRQIIEQLKDKHPLVRCQAAVTVANYGGSARAAIPTLATLAKDVEGQTWWTRIKALDAIQSMPVEPATVEAVMRAGLSDPSKSVRGTTHRHTFLSRDEGIGTKAAVTYKTEMIQQVFDEYNHVVPKVITHLKKDDLRPHLPRFFKALARPHGGRLQGSMTILASFGEEVVPKLEALASGKDERLRTNALQTLHMMAMKDSASPALVKNVTQRLKKAGESDDVNIVDKYRRLLNKLEAAKNGNK